MKQFKLMNLKLKNFKGIKEFELQANGHDLSIKGKNGSGKTTIFDAFIWLLFGKDSLNRSKFEIKTLDKDGNVKQHGIDHEVEGTFKLNDREITFKRVYREEWTKHRGSVKKTFTGHKTDYFIDDVPVKKKEYDETVNKIISDDVFQLLTNPLYFNEHLDQKKRREILFNMINNVKDIDIAINSNNKDLVQFVERLNGKDIEKHQKTIKNKQKEINQELERIPIRIDEINLTMPDIDELDKEELEAEINYIDEMIEEKQEKLNSVKNGGQTSEYKRYLLNVEMELTKIKNEHDTKANSHINRLRARLQEKESNVLVFEAKVKGQKEMLENNEERLAELNDRLEKLRSEWVEVDSEEFQHDEKCTCPTCGQDLPEEQVNEARKKAEAEFNEKKANTLESITKEGKSVKERAEMLQEDNERIKKNIEKYTEQMKENEEEIIVLKKQIEELEEDTKDITENQEYIEKLKEKEEIEKKIAELQTDNKAEIENIKEEIKALKDRKNGIQSDLNKFDIAKYAESRLKELEKNEKELTKKHEELEKELFLAEEFTRQKTLYFEEKINSKFKYARFKLFEEQVNGGLKEICETTYEGVPYNRGLNNAARINVGLDILNTLQKHYGIQVPIFIDNRESVTDLIDIESQTIGLVVDRNAQSLEVQETQEMVI